MQHKARALCEVKKTSKSQMIKARVDLESRREEPGEASELMTMEIPLLDEL